MVVLEAVFGVALVVVLVEVVDGGTVDIILILYTLQVVICFLVGRGLNGSCGNFEYNISLSWRYMFLYASIPLFPM